MHVKVSHLTSKKTNDFTKLLHFTISTFVNQLSPLLLSCATALSTSDYFNYFKKETNNIMLMSDAGPKNDLQRIS